MAAQPAAAAAALAFALPVDEKDFDCCVQLVVPSASGQHPAEREWWEPSGWQAPSNGGLFTVRASSALLKMHSTQLRDCFQRRAGEGGDRQPPIIACQDKEEMLTFCSLMNFVHSAARKLPTDPAAVMRLLLMAREHAVETCVAACLQQLLEQVGALPASLCLDLLAALDAGVSSQTAIQQQAAQLLASTKERLLRLLQQDGGTAAGRGLCEQLAAFLGPLHEALNNPLRQEVMRRLPLALLRDCVLEDELLAADTEATVLAACSFWCEHNLEALPPSAQHAELVAVRALCSRVRFPAVPPDVLLNHHRSHRFLQLFDPDKQLVLRALASAASPVQHSLWRTKVEEAGAPSAPPEEVEAALELAASCRLWWTPRSPPLCRHSAPASFLFKASRSLACAVRAVLAGGRPTASFSDATAYWGGYWWRACLKQKGEAVGAYVHAGACHAGRYEDQDVPCAALYQTQVHCRIALEHAGGGDVGEASTFAFAPTKGCGWGITTQAVTWEQLWADGSPWLHDGEAHVRVALRPAS